MPEPDRRFVVLHHLTRDGEHWDLMLERQGVLATWQLSVHPQVLRNIGASTPVRRIFDHRLGYLDYEGPISGGRGEVRRIDGGTFHLILQSPRLVFTCEGGILHGQFEIDESADAETAILRRTG